MTQLTIPNTFTSKTRALASAVNANFQAIKAVLNGGLTNDNFSSLADLDATLLSTSAGKRIVATRMENNSVDNRVLASDPLPVGTDALRAVTGDHIRTLTLTHVGRIIPAGSITSAMLQSGFIAAASIGEDKLKITIHSVAFSNGAITANSGTTTAANPTSTFAKGTYDLLGLYVKNVIITTGVVAAAQADDSGLNWAGLVRFVNATAGTGTATGSLVYVFISKL